MRKYTLKEIASYSFDKLRMAMADKIYPAIILGRQDSDGSLAKLDADTYNVDIAGVTTSVGLPVRPQLPNGGVVAGSITGDGTNDKSITLDTGVSTKAVSCIYGWIETAAGVPKAIDVPILISVSQDDSTYYEMYGVLPIPAVTSQELKMSGFLIRERYIKLTYTVPASGELCKGFIAVRTVS